MQYDVRPINLDLKAKDIDVDYKILPGHKAVITHIKTDGELIITGDKKGDLKVMNFNVFKNDIKKGPASFTIKS